MSQLKSFPDVGASQMNKYGKVLNLQKKKTNSKNFI